MKTEYDLEFLLNNIDVFTQCTSVNLEKQIQKAIQLMSSPSLALSLNLIESYMSEFHLDPIVILGHVNAIEHFVELLSTIWGIYHNEDAFVATLLNEFMDSKFSEFLIALLTERIGDLLDTKEHLQVTMEFTLRYLQKKSSNESLVNFCGKILQEALALPLKRRPNLHFFH